MYKSNIYNELQKRASHYKLKKIIEETFAVSFFVLAFVLILLVGYIYK